MKKRRLLLLFTLLLSAGLFAQESITNIVVTPKTDGSGFIDVYFDLDGPGNAYNMSIEASFDGGSIYVPIPAEYLDGDLEAINPGNDKHIIWDGLGNFPGTYSNVAKLKIIATESTLTAGLVAHYPFNGNANDESGNGNDGVVNGATLTYDRFENPNSAYEFDSNNDIIQIDHDITQWCNELTIAAWVNGNDPSGWARIVDKYRHGQKEGYLLIHQKHTNTFHFEFWATDGSLNDIASETQFQNGVWQFAVSTYDGEMLKIYVNGVCERSEIVNKDIKHTQRYLSIGNGYDDHSYLPFDGKIDDVRIYNRALTDAEIQALYFEGGYEGLVAHYPFNGNANDESGNGNDGTVVGATLSADRFGNANSAYEFDGNDSRINIGNSVKSQFPITFSAWLKPNLSMPEVQTIFLNDENDGCQQYYGFFIYCFSDGNLSSMVGNGGGAGPSSRYSKSTTSSPLVSNQWNHTLAIFEENMEIRLFVNGIEENTTSGSGTASTMSLSNMDGNIGARFACEEWNNEFFGSIDDIRIYNRVLSESEIQALYNENQPSFSCGQQLIDARDGNTYNTVQIGTQCWMAENLNVGTRIDGANEQTNNSQIEKYCYDDDSANCDIYGGLYQWDEMMQYVTTEGVQGICPPTGGWHLPTDDEWKTMEMHLGMTQAQADGTGNRGTDEGGKLKETGTTHWLSPNTGATNSSGFTALPVGYRDGFGSINYLGYVGNWWSSSEDPSAPLWMWDRSLVYNTSQVFRGAGSKTHGFSVRCLKN